MLTKKKIEEIARDMKSKRIVPFVVCSQEEAERMTKESIADCKWSVGEEYYKVDNGKLIGAVKC